MHRLPFTESFLKLAQRNLRIRTRISCFASTSEETATMLGHKGEALQKEPKDLPLLRRPLRLARPSSMLRSVAYPPPPAAPRLASVPSVIPRRQPPPHTHRRAGADHPRRPSARPAVRPAGRPSARQLYRPSARPAVRPPASSTGRPPGRPPAPSVHPPGRPPGRERVEFAAGAASQSS